jgi:oxygen-independent coproporphyrinogen-3 oxidase
MSEAIKTLYVGGGTPSLLGPQAMKGLAEVIGYSRLEDPELEWTAEANPETVTHDLVESWYNTGVNRMSLGVQSFDTKVLTWMGRLHGPDGAVQAVNAIKEVGICNLSVDLVFGLPSRLKRCWRTDLFKVLELDVPHISLYGLSIEPDTPLGRSVRDGSEFPVDEGQYRDEYLTAVELLRAAGYQHYEVSSFSHPGFASRHNSAYWDGSPYLGLGNSAHSYSESYRRWNVRDWGAYNVLATGTGVTWGEGEHLDLASRSLERLWLGLRTASGLQLKDLDDPQRVILESWVQEGWGVLEDGRVRLTAEGWLLLDRLTLELDGAPVG